MTFTKQKQMSLKLRTKYSLEAQLFYIKRWFKHNGADVLAGIALGLVLMTYGPVWNQTKSNGIGVESYPKS